MLSGIRPTCLCSGSLVRALQIRKDPVPVEKSRSVEGLEFHFSDVGLEGLQEFFLVLLLLYSHSWRDNYI